MYCEKCGKELNRDEIFCEGCGTKVERKAGGKNQIGTLLSKLPLKWVAIGAASVVAVVVTLVIILSGPKSLNPTDYIDVEISGFSGHATAFVDFDYDALLAKISGLDEDRSLDEQITNYSEYLKLMAKYEKLDSSIDYTVEYDVEKGTLKNGDVIYITFNCDEEILKEYGYKVSKKYLNQALTIGEDTEEIPEPFNVNWFEYVKCETTGYDGMGNLELVPIENEFVIENPVKGVEKIVLTTDYESSYYDQLNIKIHRDNGNTVNQKINITLDCVDDNKKLGELSNGDEVQIKITGVQNTEYYGIYSQTNEQTIQIYDLPAPIELDLLDYLEYESSLKTLYGNIVGANVNFSGPTEKVLTLGDNAQQIKEATINCIDDSYVSGWLFTSRYDCKCLSVSFVNPKSGEIEVIKYRLSYKDTNTTDAVDVTISLSYHDDESKNKAKEYGIVLKENTKTFQIMK